MAARGRSGIERATRSGALALLLPAAALSACGERDAPTASEADSVVELPPGPYTAGESFLGRNGYVEYLAGNSPVILSAPHGGDLRPSEIPDRSQDRCGGSTRTGADLHTRELALELRDEFFERFGAYPHLVINHLHRGKLDANREIGEAACGDPEAENAWREFHAFLGLARSAVLEESGRGWYMDLHGHGHEIQRLELGYLLHGEQLDLPDATLDGNGAFEDTSSVRTVSEEDEGSSFSELLRGATSLGTLYAEHGFPAVPSASDPGPRAAPYFAGGYNTERYTCGLRAGPLGGEPGGGLCGVQVEANFTGVRDTPADRERFARATVAVLDAFLSAHWEIQLDPDLSRSARRDGSRRPPDRLLERTRVPPRGAPRG